MGTRHSHHPRAAGDFYTEPDWTVSALFHHAWPEQGLHDPCAGIGTIVDVATQYGLRATGADIADRANGRFAIRNFLTNQTVYSAVVTNPPYKLAPAIILSK